jgi:nucleoside-diphosphate-sugar epimerase
MKILVTGAAGFLGRRLTAALLAGVPGLPKVSKLVAVDTVACPIDDPRVDCKTGTITDDTSRARLSKPMSTRSTTSRRS